MALSTEVRQLSVRTLGLPTPSDDGKVSSLSTEFIVDKSTGKLSVTVLDSLPVSADSGGGSEGEPMTAATELVALTLNTLAVRTSMRSLEKHFDVLLIASHTLLH